MAKVSVELAPSSASAVVVSRADADAHAHCHAHAHSSSSSSSVVVVSRADGHHQAFEPHHSVVRTTVERPAPTAYNFRLPYRCTAANEPSVASAAAASRPILTTPTPPPTPARQAPAPTSTPSAYRRAHQSTVIHRGGSPSPSPVDAMARYSSRAASPVMLPSVRLEAEPESRVALLEMLRAHLPHSIRLFRLLEEQFAPHHHHHHEAAMMESSSSPSSSPSLSPLYRDTEWWVDHLPTPLAVLCFHQGFFSFFAIDDDAGVSLLSHIDWQRLREVRFAALGERHLALLRSLPHVVLSEGPSFRLFFHEHALALRSGAMPRPPAAPPPPPPAAPPPPTYSSAAAAPPDYCRSCGAYAEQADHVLECGSLTQLDAERVLQHWIYATPSMQLERIRTLIAQKPTVAIRVHQHQHQRHHPQCPLLQLLHHQQHLHQHQHQHRRTNATGESELVAWSLTMSDGSQSFLFSMPQARRRGLGDLSSKHLIAQHVSSGRIAYWYVETANERAMALSRKQTDCLQDIGDLYYWPVVRLVSRGATPTGAAINHNYNYNYNATVAAAGGGNSSVSWQSSYLHQAKL